MEWQVVTLTLEGIKVIERVNQDHYSIRYKKIWEKDITFSHFVITLLFEEQEYKSNKQTLFLTF